jgi:hypothetical protein
MPLVNKFTVPDDMLITFFSSRSIKISHQQSPAHMMPISLIDQLLEIIKLGLSRRHAKLELDPLNDGVEIKAHDHAVSLKA